MTFNKKLISWKHKIVFAAIGFQYNEPFTDMLATGHSFMIAGPQRLPEPGKRLKGLRWRKVTELNGWL